MSDYYDPHPRVRLSQHLAVIGLPGSGSALAAHALSSVTGLPLHQVDRMVESSAGASRSSLLLERGLEALRRLDARALRRALSDRPHGIISLTPTSLVEAIDRELVRASACLVYVRRPPEILLERIRKQVQSQPGSIPEFMVAPPETVADLQPLLDEIEPGLRDAHAIVEAGDLHPRRVGDELRNLLDRIAASEVRV